MRRRPCHSMACIGAPHGGAERKRHDAPFDPVSGLHGSPFRALDPHRRDERSRGSGGSVPVAVAARRGDTAAASDTIDKATFKVTISRGEAPSGAAPFGTAPDEWSQTEQCAYALYVIDASRITPVGRRAPRHFWRPGTCLRLSGSARPVTSTGARSVRYAASVSWR
jgi:hypothetical protein